MAGAASSSAVAPVRCRKRTPEQAKIENDKRRIRNQTLEMQERRKAENAKRRSGGSSHKPLAIEARARKIKKQFNKRHRENPQMRTNAPRRKFENGNSGCLSRTNVDEVYALRYDALAQGPALDAASRRADEAEAQVEAWKKRALEAEARDENNQALINEAKRRAGIREKKQSGAELVPYEEYLESKTRAEAEAKLAKAEARLAEREAKLAEQEAKLAEHDKADARLKAWFGETGLSELLGQRDMLPTKAEVESYFARPGAAEASGSEASD